MAGERGIIFSAPMVRALLAGTKTQTRRVLPDDLQAQLGNAAAIARMQPRQRGIGWDKVKTLWVREAWAHDAPDLDACRRGVESDGMSYGPYFKATAAEFDVASLRWRSPIHMPRWASRLTLAVTDVRVEPLQDISEADAVAEGIVPFRDTGSYVSPVHADGKWRAGDNAHTMYRDLWNSIHGPGAWDANPWVAALTFAVEQRNIDAPAGPGAEGGGR